MNPIYKTCLLLTLLLFNSCNYINNIRLLTGGSMQGKDIVETIPFNFIRDIIVVDATLNGDSTTHQFIFDTGAFNSKIEYNLANTIGYTTRATKNNSTAQGVSKNIEVVRIDKINLGSIGFTNIGAGKLMYDSESVSPCIAKDGIIGANLIKLAHWKIDYQKKLLSFSDRPFLVSPYKNNYTLPFSKPLLSGVPKINLSINKQSIKGILFDVGFNGGLVLPAEFENLFESDSTIIVIDQSTTGIYGSNIDTLTTKILQVDIGGFKSRIPVEFSTIGKALLGNEFLKHFTVLINYDSKEITLIPQKEVKIEQPLTFIPAVLNDSLWTVDRIASYMPLQLGDTLLSINGKKPRDLFKNHCDYFMNIGQLLDQKALEIVTADRDTLLIKH